MSERKAKRARGRGGSQSKPAREPSQNGQKSASKVPPPHPAAIDFDEIDTAVPLVPKTAPVADELDVNEKLTHRGFLSRFKRS